MPKSYTKSPNTKPEDYVFISSFPELKNFVIKRKYKHFFILKNTRDQSEWIFKKAASPEALTQELLEQHFLRLMIPAHPETLCLEKDNRSFTLTHASLGLNILMSHSREKLTLKFITNPDASLNLGEISIVQMAAASEALFKPEDLDLLLHSANEETLADIQDALFKLIFLNSEIISTFFADFQNHTALFQINARIRTIKEIALKNPVFQAYLKRILVEEDTLSDLLQHFLLLKTVHPTLEGDTPSFDELKKQFEDILKHLPETITADTLRVETENLSDSSSSAPSSSRASALHSPDSSFVESEKEDRLRLTSNTPKTPSRHTKKLEAALPFNAVGHSDLSRNPAESLTPYAQTLQHKRSASLKMPKERKMKKASSKLYHHWKGASIGGLSGLVINGGVIGIIILLRLVDAASLGASLPLTLIITFGLLSLTGFTLLGAVADSKLNGSSPEVLTSDSLSVKSEKQKSFQFETSRTFKKLESKYKRSDSDLISHTASESENSSTQIKKTHEPHDRNEYFKPRRFSHRSF